MKQGVWTNRPDYNDPLKYYRFTERFSGINNASASAGDMDWSSSGTNQKVMLQTSTSTGAMGVKGLVAHTGTDDVSRWHQYLPSIGDVRTGMIITVRLRPQAGAFSANTMWFYGIQNGTGSNPFQAINIEAIGIRAQSSIDGKVYAVVKNGAAAVNESTVDLGAYDTTNWTTYQMRIGASSVHGYKNGVLQGSTALGSNFDTSINSYVELMAVYNEFESGASQRIIDTTLFDVIVPTGGW